MKRVYGTSLVALCLLALCFLFLPVRATGGRFQMPVPVLLPHKAGYTLSLVRQKSGSLAAAGGHASYQLRDLCESWSVSQKLDVQIVSGDGSTSLVSYQSATLEDKKGRRFLFRTIQTQNNETISETAGEAKRQRDGRVVVHFTRPEIKTLTLSARTVFPTQYIVLLLDAAHHGALHLQSELFDGASSDGVTPSFATLGRLAKASSVSDNPIFKGLSAVPVSVASFGEGEGSLLPDSIYSDRLWSNGVEDKLMIDFGDYVLSGAIDSLTSFPTPDCRSANP